MIKEIISLLVEGKDLSDMEMSECMNEIMEGRATDAQIASFITALRLKGETVEEITAAARVMRDKSSKIKAPDNVIDTCGTGGDLAGTFNISTTTAIILASCNIPTAKHGNRSVSSRSGSADVLEALGVKIDLAPEKVEICLFETGFGFLFAPLFHPAMKYAVTPRREIGIRTIFNILGPITNPAGAKRQIIGVFSEEYAAPMAEAAGSLGAEDVMVLHGKDGLDEITITDKTEVWRYKNKSLSHMTLSPEDFGLKRGRHDDIRGGDNTENAAVTTALLNGEKGTRRDIVVLNAAAAIMVSGKTEIPKEAAAIVEEAIDSGNAIKKLNQIKEITNSL